MKKETNKIKIFFQFHIDAITDKDVWKNNDKMNIQLFVVSQLKKAMEDAYCSGFDEAEKVFKRRNS